MLLRNLYLKSRPLVQLPFRTIIKNPFNTENNIEEKQEKAFREDINYFLQKEVFTLHDFHERVKMGLKEKSGIRNMLSGQDEEKAVLDQQHKLLCAMYDEEKTDFDKLEYEKKIEICEVA